MKKILVPFTLSVVLLFVACSSGGGSSSSSSGGGASPTPTPTPEARVTGLPLPEFNTTALVGPLSADNYNEWSKNRDATTLTIAKPHLIDACYKLDRVKEILQGKDSKTLKTIVPNGASSTLCYIKSLNDLYTQANLVADGKEHDMMKNGAKVGSYQHLTEKGADATYYKLVVYDLAKKENFAMIWSNETWNKEPVKRLLVFSVADNPEKDDLTNRPKVYSFVAAYQDASGFNLRSAVVASTNDFFSYTKSFGIRTQLAYDASEGAFQAVETYEIGDPTPAPRGIARLVTQGNIKTGHAGHFEIKHGAAGWNFPGANFYFGSFATPADATAYKGLVSGIDVQAVEGQVTEPKTMIGDPLAKVPSEVAKLANIETLNLPVLSGAIFK